VLFVFSLGVGLILSNLFILIRDISQVWPLIAQLMMWLSPIFFSAEILSSKIPFITFINPMFGMISNLRNVLMHNTPPDFNLLLINTLHAVLAIGIGLLLLNKIGARVQKNYNEMEKKEISIQLKSVSKTFSLSEKSHTTLKQSVFNLFKVNSSRQFKALNDIN
jgi:hypothetical protein